MMKYFLAGILIFIMMIELALGDDEECVKNRTECEKKTNDRKKLYSKVCGSDNVTYINQCYFDTELCKGRKIEMKHVGRCRNKQPCFKDAKKFQKTRNRNGSFVPTCLKDGRYAPVQCHKETGYCWCVTPRGRPIPNTSKLYQKPKCSKRFKTRRRASARKSDREFCGRNDKQKFNENLMNLFRAEYGKDLTNDEDTEYLNQKILNWKFESIDLNGDDFLQRAEYRILKRLKKLVKPKRCAKTFAKLCDMDKDLRISKEEWSACLGVTNMATLKGSDITALSGQLPGFEHMKRKDEPEANDCFSDRQAVLSEQRSNNLYVPECTQDGRYNRIQCYKSTGYCWCVHEDDGKPIPGTSVKDQAPKCDSIPVPVRPMKGCPGEKKEIFLNDLKDFLWSKLSKNGTRYANDKIALLSFSSLDSNNNKYLERKEWKTFRALVAGNKNLRRCGKRLPRFCDVNNDRRISITEWTNCLDNQRTSRHVPSNATTQSSPLKRRGPNPLESFLKDDD